MGRKKLQPATDVVVADLGATPAHIAQQEAEVRHHLQAVVEQFGDGLPWHPDHYEAAIKAEMRRGCEAFLRAGRYLVVARTCAPHGEWLGMLERIGVGARQAQRMMEAAHRIASLPNPSTSTQLVAAAKSEGKLIELLSLPEEQFAELAVLGETGGLELDDVEKMTVKELRDAVREARADIEAKDERAAKRERDIERKTAEIAKLKRQGAQATPDEVTTQLRRDLDAEAIGIQAAIMADGKGVSSLRTRMQALINHAEQSGDNQDVHLAGIFAQLERWLHTLRDEFGIERVAVGDPAIEARLSLGQEG